MNTFLNNMNVVLFHIGNVTLTLGGLMASMLVLTFGYWLARKLRFLIYRIIGPRFRIERNTAFALGAMVFYAIVSITTVIGLSLLGFDLSNLAIIAGALSIGIGLGLQGIANNFVSGLLLLFDSSIFLRAIHHTLVEHHFEIPFPQRDVHIRTLPDALLQKE